MRTGKINIAVILFFDLVLILLIMQRSRFIQLAPSSSSNMNTGFSAREKEPFLWLNYPGTDMDSVALKRHIVGLE